MTVPFIYSPVVRACYVHWDAFKGDCSGFVKTVARDVGCVLTGQANNIVDQLRVAPWSSLKDGKAAQIKAQAGYLVIAGLKYEKNGHVVVVVPGPLFKGKFPRAFWGKLDGIGRKDTTITMSFKEADLNKVIYAYAPVQGVKA